MHHLAHAHRQPSFNLKPLTALILGTLALQAQAADTFVDAAPLLSNTTYSQATAVSADGSTMVGEFTNSSNNNEAFRWNNGTMTGLGFLNATGSTYQYSSANAVSADGSTVVGASSYGSNNENSQAFRWNNGTMTGLGFLGAGKSYSDSTATAVSADGSTVVGESTYASSTNSTQAFRWNNGTMTGLGFLDTTGNINKYSYPYAVSANGSTVVGESRNSAGNSEAFRWNNGTMTGLGFLDTTGNNNYSFAYAVSADGSTVVGDSGNSAGNTEAFRWNNGTMTGLGFLDTTGSNSYAKAVSADGSTVVGNSGNSAGNDEAFRWNNGKMTGLGFLDTTGNNSYSYSYANAVSADGSTVVGYSGNSLGKDEAFRWNKGTGMQSITSWLAAAGVTAPAAMSTKFSEATGVSANGHVVVGNYDDDKGNGHAWLARVGEVGNGLLTDIGAFNSGLIDAGSRIIQASSALPNLALFGAHHRSILDNGLARSGSNGSCAWATTDAAQNDNTNTRSELAEVGVCKDFGSARFGIGIGHAWTHQNLSLDGNAHNEGQYFLLEGAKTFENGLQPSVTAYLGRFDSKIARHYMNGVTVDSSNASTNVNANAVRARLDWKDAKTIGRFSLSPYTAYTWSNSSMDAYTETGGGFPAYFDKSDWTTNDLRIGTAAKTALSPATDLRLGAEVAHRFEKNTSGVNGNVIGLWNFSLPGQTIDQTWTRVTVDIDHRISDTVSLTVGGNAASNGGDATWGVTLGLRATF